MNQKNVIVRFLSLNRPPIGQWFTIFSKMVTWLNTWLINTIFTLWNVKDDEFFMWAKLWFSAIIYTEVLANKSFCTDLLTQALSHLSRLPFQTP